MASQVFDKIYTLILKIPKGKVATYGQIAAMAGRPGAARTVGWALASSPDDLSLPWQRVLNASGRSSFPSQSKRKLQQALLEAEGIKFDKNDQVDLGVYQWDGR